MRISEGTYQGLFYGSPLAYLLPLERFSAAGFGYLRGKRVADFGHGGIGQLRLFAAIGAEAVGIDVDAVQPVLYAAPGDQGPFGKAGGSVRLVHGPFPADPRVVAAVGGYDLFVSKNTLRHAAAARSRGVGRGLQPGRRHTLPSRGRAACCT
jgi:hypothetical protein